MVSVPGLDRPDPERGDRPVVLQRPVQKAVTAFKRRRSRQRYLTCMSDNGRRARPAPQGNGSACPWSDATGITCSRAKGSSPGLTGHRGSRRDVADAGLGPGHRPGGRRDGLQVAGAPPRDVASATPSGDIRPRNDRTQPWRTGRAAPARAGRSSRRATSAPTTTAPTSQTARTVTARPRPAPEASKKATLRSASVR